LPVSMPNLCVTFTIEPFLRYTQGLKSILTTRAAQFEVLQANLPRHARVCSANVIWSSSENMLNTICQQHSILEMYKEQTRCFRNSCRPT